jgi:hypothetical protein
MLVRQFCRAALRDGSQNSINCLVTSDSHSPKHFGWPSFNRINGVDNSDDLNAAC